MTPLEKSISEYRKAGLVCVPSYAKKGSFPNAKSKVLDDESCQTIELKKGWRTTDAEQMDLTDWSRYKAAAVVTGKKSGIIVLDFDLPAMQVFEELRDEGYFRDSAIANTPSGGKHVYFDYDPNDPDITNITTSAKKFYYAGKFVDVDVRTDGGLAYIPPSTIKTADGKWLSYRWEKPPRYGKDGKIGNLGAISVLKNETFSRGLLRRGYVFSPKFEGYKPNSLAEIKRDYPNRLRKQNLTDHPGKYPAPSLDTLEVLLSLLSDQRADSYDDWIRVGLALKRGFLLCDSDALEDLNGSALFRLFSQRSDKYDEVNCAQTYEQLDVTSREGPNFGSLYLWAQQDSPKEYEEFKLAKRRAYQPLLYNSHRGMATYLKQVLQDLYYIDVEDKPKGQKKMRAPWLFYNEATRLWEFTTDQILLATVSETLHNEVSKMIREIDEDDEEDKTKRKKPLLSILKEVNSTTFVNNVIKQMVGIFYDKSILQKFDYFTDDLPVRGGLIYNQATGKTRPRTRNDFYTSELPVRVGAQPNHPRVKKFFEDLFPDTEERIYMRRIIGHLTTKSPPNRSADFWLGAGSNGKTILCNLLMTMLGDFASSLPKTVIMNCLGSDDYKQPQYVPLISNRVCFIDETNKEDKLNPDAFKKITGGSVLTFRLLGSNENITSKAKAKLVISTNDPPEIEVTEASEARVRLEVFSTKFVTTPTEGTNQREKDDDLVEWLQNTTVVDSDGFTGMDYLFAWTQVGAKKVLASPILLSDIPEGFENAKYDYISENDKVGLWVKEHLKVEDAAKIALNDIYVRYKEQEGLEAESRATLYQTISRIHPDIQYTRPKNQKTAHGITLV
jgi:phage/plasmid-associated DNA primase